MFHLGMLTYTGMCVWYNLISWSRMGISLSRHSGPLLSNKLRIGLPLVHISFEISWDCDLSLSCLRELMQISIFWAPGAHMIYQVKKMEVLIIKAEMAGRYASSLRCHRSVTKTKIPEQLCVLFLWIEPNSISLNCFTVTFQHSQRKKIEKKKPATQGEPSHFFLSIEILSRVQTRKKVRQVKES